MELQNQLKALEYMCLIVEKLKKTPFLKRFGEEGLWDLVINCHNCKIEVFSGLAQMNVVKGKIELSSSLMNAMVRCQGHSITEAPESTSECCVLIGKRKDSGDEMRVKFSLREAQNAGLLETLAWKKFPEAMLFSRAVSKLCRRLFPDIIGGMYDEGELSEGADISDKNEVSQATVTWTPEGGNKKLLDLNAIRKLGEEKHSLEKKGVKLSSKETKEREKSKDSLITESYEEETPYELDQELNASSSFFLTHFLDHFGYKEIKNSLGNSDVISPYKALQVSRLTKRPIEEMISIGRESIEDILTNPDYGKEGDKVKSFSFLKDHQVCQDLLKSGIEFDPERGTRSVERDTLSLLESRAVWTFLSYFPEVYKKYGEYCAKARILTFHLPKSVVTDIKKRFNISSAQLFSYDYNVEEMLEKMGENEKSKEEKSEVPTPLPNKALSSSKKAKQGE